MALSGIRPVLVGATAGAAVLAICWSRRRREACDEEDDAVESSEDASPVELEDLEKSVGPARTSRAGQIRRRVAPAAVGESAEDLAVAGESGDLPGKQKVFVKTFGCAHNSSDSEFMMGLLSEYGYTLATNLEEADVMVVNSCSVKNPSQDSAVNLTKKAQAAGKQVVLAGCVPSADKELVESLKDVSVLDVSQIERIVEVVEEAAKGNTIKLMTKRKVMPSLELPKIRRNNYVEIIPISGGCLGNCSYCKTKHARGKLNSYTEDAVVKRALTAAAEGVSEVWLTSEDTGAYGLDIGTNIANLLRRVSDELPNGVMLKLGMTNPPYMLAHIDAVAEVLLRPNVFEFIHIPVQSGSDEVLRSMVREYSCGDFRRLVDGLRAQVPALCVATDVICGFPAEAEDHHKETLQLVEDYHFPVLNISQFYPRPGTAAAKMRKLDGKTVKRRSGEMTKAFESYKTYDHLVGTEARAWFSETDLRHNQTVGHTKAYAKVVVPRDDSLLGQSAMVSIHACSKWHVEAKVK